MKFKKLLPIVFVAVMGLAACGGGGKKPITPTPTPTPSTHTPTPTPSETPTPTPTPSPSLEDVYTVEITNKEDLTAEWFVGEKARVVTVAATKNGEEVNAMELLNDEVFVTSSNSDAVTALGFQLSPVAAGKSTITVTYNDVSDSVEVELKANDAKGKYGTEHLGTLEDPFTNEDALLVAKHEKYADEDYYIQGVVSSFYNAPGSRTDGMVAFYLAPAEEGGEKFEIYRCFGENNTPLTDDDIWVNGTVTVLGTKFTVYNGQYETTSATFISCEGNKPEARKTIEATFAEVMTACAGLADGADSYDYYKFQGYVASRSGKNYFLTATQGEALVEAQFDETHTYYSNAIELYNVSDEAVAALLLEGAKVEVTMVVKNYHGQLENGLNLTADDVTVVEPGTPWSVPEPAVATRTLKEFIDGEDTKAKAYNVTAEVKYWKNETAAKDKYGNMILTDGTNDLTIYGASATATALAWDNVSAYAFQNPQDFLTNEVTGALAIGDTVTMKLIRADYKGAVQGTGVITDVVPGAHPTPTPVPTPTPTPTPTPSPVDDSKLVLTYSSLGLNQTSYAANNGDHEVGDITFTTNAMMKKNGGECIQAQKANATLLNVDALPKAIASIEVNYNTMGYSDNNVTFEFAAATLGGETPATAVETKTLVTVKDTLQYVITPEDTTYTFFKMSNPTGGAHYFDSIVINYVEEGVTPTPTPTPTPVEIAQPVGTFYGTITVGGAAVFSNIALGNEKAFVEFGEEKFTTTYSYDKSNGLVTIALGGNYGNFTATYDPENNALTNGAVDGAAAALIPDAINLNAAPQFFGCEGTAEDLQGVFKRRVGSNETGKVELDSENVIGGEGAVKLPGNGSGDVRLNLRNDVSGGQATKNFGFWVFNPSESNVKIRVWIYKAANLGNNAELTDHTTGGTAIAPGWTYLRFGLDATIYNFQIADFSNSGVNLTFDNIAIY